jgi:hypothetical protein
MDSGEPERVLALREDFQRVMASRFHQVIEELTGRNVVAFVSRGHVEPDITMEIFFIDGPLRASADPTSANANRTPHRGPREQFRAAWPGRRSAGRCAELPVGGIGFPAAGVCELGLDGYAVERVHDHTRLVGVRPRHPESPGQTRCTPPAPAVARPSWQ